MPYIAAKFLSLTVDTGVIMKFGSKSFLKNFAIKAALQVFLFSLAHNSYAAREYMEFEPLLGSQWAQEHPGELPYSKCSLVRADYPLEKIPLHERGTWKTPTDKIDRAGIVIGSTVSKEEFYFSCVSQNLGLAFMLPIKLKHIVHFPEVAVIGLVTYNHFHFNKKSLSEKRVASLLKGFVGLGLDASLLVGGGGYGYVNRAGLLSRVTTGEISVGIGHAAAGLSTMKLKRVRDEKLPKQSMTQNGAFLITNERASHTLEEPIVVCNDGNCGIKTAEISLHRKVLRTIQIVNAKGETEPVENLMTTRVVIPAGTMAMWNGRGFEIEYFLKGDSGEKRVKEVFSSVTALDNSVVDRVINGHVFIGRRNGSVILHRTNGSIVRDNNDSVNLDEIKNMKLVWDKNLET